MDLQFSIGDFILRKTNKKSVFSSDYANVVVGKDYGIRFVVSGFVGTTDRPETGERISLRRKTNFRTFNLASNDVQVVVSILKNVKRKRYYNDSDSLIFF